MRRAFAWNVLVCAAVVATLLIVDQARAAHSASSALSASTAGAGEPATTTASSPAAMTEPTTKLAVGSLGWAAALQQVADYASGRSGDLEVSIADLGLGVVYDAPTPQPPLRTASIVKVAIAVTVLRQDEAAGRAPSADEMAMMAAMIENSDNGAAQQLWDAVGGASGVQPTLDAVGMPSTTPHEAAWGFSTTTAADQARLLLALDDGSVLSPDDTAQILDLMRNVEADQRVGPADAAPGLDPAVKDGWYPDTDLGVWRVHCLAIFDAGVVHPFAISILTRYDINLGQDFGEQTCQDVTALVLPTATEPAGLAT